MTSDKHVKYDKTLKSQSIQQQYIGIIISTSMTSDTHVKYDKTLKSQSIQQQYIGIIISYQYDF